NRRCQRRSLHGRARPIHARASRPTTRRCRLSVARPARTRWRPGLCAWRKRFKPRNTRNTRKRRTEKCKAEIYETGIRSNELLGICKVNPCSSLYGVCCQSFSCQLFVYFVYFVVPFLRRLLLEGIWGGGCSRR